MSTIRLRLGDEVFDIPTVGASNWGEQVTLYLRKNSEIIATIQGPQDKVLTDYNTANNTSGDIKGLSFDTSSVQQILVEGLIIRSFSSEVAKVDSFNIEGVYDGQEFHISNTYSGTDAKVKLDITDTTGQFTYVADDVQGTSGIKIRFRAKAIIDLDI